MGMDIRLNRKLKTFDVTNLVVGSIIGADIYVAAAFGSRLVGPSSLIIWVIAGAMAMVIALSFAYSATIFPRTGGSFAYTTEVSKPFAGFTVGWALFLAEWFSLAVFPVAFAQYFVALFPGDYGPSDMLLKGAFILIILLTNVIGIKAAGRVNDVLTIAKLGPLIMIAVVGVIFMALNPNTVASNLTPFFSGNASGLPQALVLIFWAYAGFELSTLPAGEIERPERTIPRSIIIGMTIVISFYLITNLVIISSVDQATLATSKSPLINAASALFASWPTLAVIASFVVGIGALISILGSDESGTIGTSRLSYAIALDGLFPRAFGRIHPRFQTPYIGLMIICLTAFVVSVIGGLQALINSSVFLLAFAYLATCVSTILLARKYPKEASKLRWRTAIPVAGCAFSILLMVLVSPQQIAISMGLLLAGIPVYAWFSPKSEISELRSIFMSRNSILERTYVQGERFLAYPLRRLKLFFYRVTNTARAWEVREIEKIRK